MLEGPCLSGGIAVERFEAELAQRCGTAHAVAVSSGTAGLHLAVIAAGVGDDDFVVTSPFSFVASANAVLYERAVPLFVDIDPDTLMPDPAAMLEASGRLVAKDRNWTKLLPRTGVRKRKGALRAVLPVHLFGRPMEIEGLQKACRSMGVPLIEDACESIGAAIGSRAVGSIGEAGVFAFYPNKQMTCGEGGMIVTDSADWARLFRSLRNQGRDEQGPWLHHSRLGFNYRLDEMSAALGLAQSRRLDEILRRREEIAAGYRELFELVDGAAPLPLPPAHLRMSWFTFMIRLEPDVDRTQLMSRLEERGVPTRPYFSPIHLQPLYVERFGYRPGDFPHAEEAGRRLLAVPFHSSLRPDDLAYVAEQLRLEIPLARRRPVQLAVTTVAPAAT